MNEGRIVMIVIFCTFVVVNHCHSSLDGRLAFFFLFFLELFGEIFVFGVVCYGVYICKLFIVVCRGVHWVGDVFKIDLMTQ